MKTYYGPRAGLILSRSWKGWGMIVLMASLTLIPGVKAQTTAGNFTLTVNHIPEGAGTVIVTPDQEPGGGYKPGTIVTVRAVPTVHTNGTNLFLIGTNRFMVWTGFTNSFANPVRFPMTTNLSISAHYVVATNPVEIVWRYDASPRRLAKWLVFGTDLRRSVSLGIVTNEFPNEWRALETADLNGDEESDIVFENVSTRRLGVWFMTGTNHFATNINLSGSANVRLAGVADFNGDTQPDFLFQRLTTNNLLTLVQMDGLVPIATNFLRRPLGGWRVTGTYDFDDDGDPDLLFHHNDGRLRVGLVENMTNVTSVAITATAKGWRVAGIDDFDGDEKNDFLFEHPTGLTAVWHMDGTNRLAVSRLRKGKPVAPFWRIVGTTGAD